MVSRGVSWFVAAGLSLPILGGRPPKPAPIPRDPLEMVSGQIQSARTPASRAPILELLGRARDNYSLRTADQGYDLKISFTVDSGGETQYDGAWQMEDRFDRQQGLRWTATADGGYTITEISSHGDLYAEGTPGGIPLRLHEARAALFGPLPSAAELMRDSIRTSEATFLGTPVTCVLLSRSGDAAAALPGRRWEETEECIDPQSGLLMVHSQVPGRYYAYDYSNAPQFAGHVFPRKVIVTEAGKPVSQISVDSLNELRDADPNWFAPTPAMQERGRAIAMGEAQKISAFAGRPPFNSGAKPHSVCVFGLVTASGELVEAHSLQPSDPYSQAAVDAAKHINFSRPPKPGQIGEPPRQHFVFVIERFVSSR